ncbi:MAG: fibronectin type III domain-containing protein [Bacteroidia bacterium]|nr:fibronectin type III domain-containing protein [Bacteroidia bacterium]
MKTITRKIFALTLVMCGMIFSQNIFAACNAPTGLSTTSITSSSATLNWNAVSNAQSYNIQYRVVGAPTWIATTSASNTKAISSLTASSNYEWQVQTRCNGNSTSSWTSSATFSTLPSGPVCNVPTGLNTASITNTAATLNWSAVTGATGYNIRYRIVSTATWTTATSTSNSKAISSLTASSNYEWQVQTNCGSSNLSAFSGSATFTTLAPPCNTPTGLSSTGVTTTDATLNWTAVSGGVGYNIRYRVVGNPTWTSTTSTSNTKNISSLTASSNYEFQVQTNCGSSNLSAFSGSATFTTLAPTCNTPTGLSSTNITSSDATLSWTAVSGATGYVIRYRVVGVPTWSIKNATTNTKTLLGLNAISNYEWQVHTVCSSSNSSTVSSTANFMTLISPAPLCSVPTGLSTTGITASAATLNWSAVTGALGYRIQYRVVGAPSWTSAATTVNLLSAGTSLTVSSLVASSNYEWLVQTSCGNANYSAYSSLETFTSSVASGPVCSTPAGLNSTAITATSATLNWSAVAGAVVYNVQYRVVGAPSWTSAISQAAAFSPPSASIIISSLTASSNYEWQVQTDCGNASLSAFSSSDVFTTNVVVCNFPAALGTSNITPASATIRWSFSANAVGYNIRYRQVGAGSWTIVTTSPAATIAATSESFVITALSPSTNYEWQVQTDCGNSNFSGFGVLNLFTTTPATSGCSDVPVSLTSAIVTSTSAILSWSLGSGAPTPAGYNVEYKLFNDISWTAVNTTTPSLTLTSLSSSGVYQWRVQTDCGNSLSAFSNTSIFSMVSHNQPTNTSTSPIASIPDPNNPATWVAVFVSSGDAATDAQIVHDWLLAHGCIK